MQSSAAAQTAAGQIKAAKVEGQVSRLSAIGTTTPLKNGDLLTETDTVITGKGASVVLVFMNGSSVKLGSESRLAIDEFRMDPLAEDLKLADYTGRDKDEPGISQTKLNLAYGEMVGDVKKLNKSSSYSIKTPVGAAGIRGTIYRIVYRPAANGKAFFTVSTADGLVVMQGVTTADIPIAKGKEVVVQIDTANPGNPTFVTQDIPTATTNAINAATDTIKQVLANTVITPPPPPAVPPPPQPAPTTLTPGAGG